MCVYVVYNFYMYAETIGCCFFFFSSLLIISINNNETFVNVGVNLHCGLNINVHLKCKYIYENSIYESRPLCLRLMRAYGPTSGSVIKSYRTFVQLLCCGKSS